MLRIANQLKDLVSSNVTSALDALSDPGKMLHKLQREVEESIIALEGDRARSRQRITQLEAQLTQNEMREADWSDKARAAMQGGNEDLARQTLMAREDCRELIARTSADLSEAQADLAGIEGAIRELEIKREDARQRAQDQAAAEKRDGKGGSICSPPSTDQRLERISRLERRTEFATDGVAQSRDQAAVNREIEAMQRASTIEAELDSMRGGPAPAKRGRRKAG